MSDTQQVAVVTGVLNKRSLAYGIVKAMLDQNIKVICLVQPGVMKHARRALDDSIEILPCDVEGLPNVDAEGRLGVDANGKYVLYREDDPEMTAAVDYIKATYGKIQYLVHAIAHSDKAELEGDMRLATRNNFHHTMEVSAFSFVRLALRFEDVMDDDASIGTLTFRGSSATAGSYMMMGLAKAALESAVRYLAQFYGLLNRTRVIGVAPGPVKTMAAMGIGDFDLSFEMGEIRSFLGHNPDADEIGRTYLKFAQSEGVTAAILPVDGGVWDGVGMGTTPAEQEAYRLFLADRRQKERQAKTDGLNKATE
jgi:enoyl-[acyl-carrier protein] reductase I